MLLVIFTETKGGWCVSQEGTCAGGVVEWPLGSSPQRHWGARAGVQVAPSPLVPSRPSQVWAPSAGHQVREAPSQSGAWRGGGLWHL